MSDWIDQEFRAATTHLKAGRWQAAHDGFVRILTSQPSHVYSLQNLAVVAHHTAHYDAAVRLNQQALQLDANNAQTWFNLGLALRSLDQFEQATHAFRCTIELKPDYGEAHSCLGNCLRDRGLFDEALVPYQQAVLCRPDLSTTNMNLGIGLSDVGRFGESIAAHSRAVEANPDDASAHWSLALSLLRERDNRGWPEYEWRWKAERFPSPPRNFAQPLWHGEPLNGRTILIHLEQGFGDSIQFARYVSLVAARGGRVLLEYLPPLERLFRCIPNVAKLVPKAQEEPNFDVHCPLLSLPLMLGSMFDFIPPAPYLLPKADWVVRWKTLVPASENRRRVGLVWAGGKSEKRRCVPFGQLVAALTEVKDVQFFSLQKGPASAELATAAAVLPIVDLTGNLDDFADTAALMKNLDLVITVDTAVAHLAGAIGVPVWTMLMAVPDWRWFRDRDDSPWYPSMRLFRQTRHDHWDDVLQNVVDALTHLS